MAQVRIGTSGWSYDHWAGLFYPGTVSRNRRLEYYATVFDTVEVNGTFYGTPSAATVRRWYEVAPAGFSFAIKGSRYVTHNRKLEGVAESVERHRRMVAPLGEKLGPTLWQFSPSFPAHPERLAEFLQLRAEGERWALEFRHESWFADEILELLGEAGCALVWADTPNYPLHLQVTADFLYARLHGHERLYASGYSDQQLGWWKARLCAGAENRRDIFVYFDNDAHAHAPRDALRLRAMFDDCGPSEEPSSSEGERRPRPPKTGHTI
jgi:uncharacterized protein YecE (DUF72 family)